MGFLEPLRLPLLNRVVAIISGHMHWFEGIVFNEHQLPTQLAVGNGGTQLIPEHNMNMKGLNGLTILGHPIHSSLVDVNFGYSTLTRGYTEVHAKNDVSRRDYSFAAWMTHKHHGEWLWNRNVWSTIIPHQPRTPIFFANGTRSTPPLNFRMASLLPLSVTDGFADQLCVCLVFMLAVAVSVAQWYSRQRSAALES